MQRFYFVPCSSFIWVLAQSEVSPSISIFFNHSRKKAPSAKSLRCFLSFLLPLNQKGAVNVPITPGQMMRQAAVITTIAMRLSQNPARTIS